MKTIRVGIVGAGGIAQYYHIPSFKRCAGVEVAAACDIADATLAKAKEMGVKRTYHDYEEMLGQEELDLVSVCTSNDMHYPVVMAAIARGLDIYCEKPLALNYAQAQQMTAAAQAKGIRTGVNFSHRRTPASMLAKEIIDSGALGPIHYVSAVYAAGRPKYAENPGTWRNDKTRAGFGGMGDMGSHMLDMMLWWLGGEVSAVACQMRTVVPERVSRETGRPMKVTTEDQGMLLLDYACGAMGYLCGSYIFTGRGYDQRVEVFGANGGLMYNQQRPYELDVYLEPECLRPYQVLRQGGVNDTPYTTILVPERLHGAIPGEPGARRTVLMDFMDAYRAEGPFRFAPGFREGLRVQEILEASQCAADQRRWVDLPL